MPFLPDNHSDTIRQHLNLRILHKCPQFGEEVERERLTTRWAKHFREFTVDFIHDILRADDCSAYLGYILLYYDRLPDKTIFLHADVGEHIPHLNMLQDLTLAAVGGYVPDLQFSHLAHNYVKLGEGAEKMRVQCEKKKKEMPAKSSSAEGHAGSHRRPRASTSSSRPGSVYSRLSAEVGLADRGPPNGDHQQHYHARSREPRGGQMKPYRAMRGRTRDHWHRGGSTGPEFISRSRGIAPVARTSIPGSAPASFHISDRDRELSRSEQHQSHFKTYDDLEKKKRESQEKLQEGSVFSRFCRGDGDIADDFEWPRLWKKVFQSSVAPSPVSGDVNAYCCVQFVVARDAILRRPKAFYENAFEHFRTEESYLDLFPTKRYVRKVDVLGRTPCQLSMYMWHAMFGAELSMERRQYDPKLPYFLKVRAKYIWVDHSGFWRE